MRQLRDELERLQVEARGLEAELLVDHAPAFLARRKDAAVTLTKSRDALAELEKAVVSATTDERAASVRVEKLADELHALEQQRLSAAPFVLLPVAFGVVAWLLRSGLPYGPAAFACALSLGFLFGPRLLDWAQPGRQRAPLAPHLARSFLEDVWRNPGAVALGLSVLAAGLAALVGTAVWAALAADARFSSTRLDVEPHFILSFPVQLLGGAGVLLALRAMHRSPQAGRRTALAAAALGSLSLLAIAVTWVPEWGNFFRYDGDSSLPWAIAVVELVYPLSAFALLVPLGLALWAQRRLPGLLGSFGFTALSVVVTLAVWRETRFARHQVWDLAGLWTALELGVGALVLALGFAAGESRALRSTRRVGVAAAILSLAAALLAYALR